MRETKFRNKIHKVFVTRLFIESTDKTHPVIFSRTTNFTLLSLLCFYFALLSNFRHQKLFQNDTNANNVTRNGPNSESESKFLHPRNRLLRKSPMEHEILDETRWKAPRCFFKRHDFGTARNQTVSAEQLSHENSKINDKRIFLVSAEVETIAVALFHYLPDFSLVYTRHLTPVLEEKPKTKEISVNLRQHVLNSSNLQKIIKNKFKFYYFIIYVHSL